MSVSSEIEQIAALKKQVDDLIKAAHALEVSANTVIYCYAKRPENFASALTGLQADANAVRALEYSITGK